MCSVWCYPLRRFVSLVPKVEISDGDDQSQTVVSWLLIVLGVTLWTMAIVQCFWEVREIGLPQPFGGEAPGLHCCSVATSLSPRLFTALLQNRRLACPNYFPRFSPFV